MYFVFECVCVHVYCVCLCTVCACRRKGQPWVLLTGCLLHYFLETSFLTGLQLAKYTSLGGQGSLVRGLSPCPLGRDYCKCGTPHETFKMWVLEIQVRLWCCEGEAVDLLSHPQPQLHRIFHKLHILEMWVWRERCLQSAVPVVEMLLHCCLVLGPYDFNSLGFISLIREKTSNQTSKSCEEWIFKD